MDLTLNIKVYNTKKLLEVNLHDIRKNTNPISQKTEVHFSGYFKYHISNVWGQISRKLHVGFQPNVICKTVDRQQFGSRSQIFFIQKKK